MQKPRFLASLMFTLILCGCSLASAVNENSQGQIDFTQLSGLKGLDPEVNISLNSGLLGLARLAAKESDDKDLQWMKGLESMRVKIYKLSGSKDDQIMSSSKALLKDLNKQGWETVVKVNENNELVYILTLSDEVNIKGLTIIALDAGDEAVFVNFSGSIDHDQIAKLIAKAHVNADIEIDL
ncbi:MAG: DUF4252 domain-containing protein [bacterium]